MKVAREINYLSGFMLAVILSAGTLLGQENVCREQDQTGSEASGEDIRIHVTRTTGSVRIDGLLDEPAWEGADPYESRFFQQEPLDREPSSQRTEVRVLQDDSNLYFGIRCYEDDPSKIFATVKRRDGSFLSDDALELLIDTFQDHRNSYAFGTNPFGAKVDAIISDEGGHINKSWDCIWYCKTSIDDTGWNVEMAIPFKSLKYKKGRNVDWGLNITREVKHSKEVTYLAPIPRGLGHNGKFKGSLFGVLADIETPEGGLNMEVEPYLTTSRTDIYEPRNSDTQIDGGVDVRYNVTPQMTFDFTYNTDFAQVEADEAIVNVTRFNVNLPEKRDFFLQGAGLFQFGASGQSGGSVVGYRSQNEFKLFESRTIGIRDEQKIPLYGGAKLAGKAGDWSIGVLNFQSKETSLADGAIEPSTNFTALKIKRDLFTNSNVGFMYLNKQSSTNAYSRALGADCFFAFTPEITFSGTLANNLAPGVDENNWAGDAGIVMNKEWIDLSLRYTFVDTLFNPEMSFIRRGNVRSTDAMVSFTKWLNNNYLKSISLVNDLEYQADNHNNLDTRELRFNTYWTFRSEDFIDIGVHRKFEWLPNVDYIQDIPIDPGDYLGTHYHLTFKSYRSRRFAGSVAWRWGDELDGKTRRLTLTTNTKISNSLFMDLEYSYQYLNLVHGVFEANIFAGLWTYSFTTDLFAKCYVQWNDADNRIVSNFLIDYIYKPKSHLYLVFNENRNTYADAMHEVNERLLTVKFTYLYSL